MGIVRTDKNYIHSLPPELLSHIFHLFVHASDGYPIPQLRVLCSVSSLWRSTALTYPLLWQFINSISPPSLVIKFLDKSGQAPLHIVHDDSQYRNVEYSRKRGQLIRLSDFLEVLVPHSHRWQTFHVDGGYLTERRFWSLVTRPAPLLEEFELVRGEYQSDQSEVTIKLFSNNAPRLRVLSLPYFYFSSNTTLLASVTHLTLHHNMHNTSPSLSQLLAALKTCPNLERLHLYSMKLESSSEPSPPLQLQLPLLQHFQCLDMPLHDVTTILSHIEFAQLKYIMINVQTDTGFTLSDLINSFMKAGLENTTKWDALEFSQFQTSFGEQLGIAASIQGNQALDATIRMSYYPGSLVQLGQLNLPRVRQLTLGSNHDPAAGYGVLVQSLLEMVSNTLVNLKLERVADMRPILEYLSRKQEGNHIPTWACPSLKVIEINQSTLPVDTMLDMVASRYDKSQRLGKNRARCVALRQLKIVDCVPLHGLIYEIKDLLGPLVTLGPTQN